MIDLVQGLLDKRRGSERGDRLDGGINRGYCLGNRLGRNDPRVMVFEFFVGEDDIKVFFEDMKTILLSKEIDLLDQTLRVLNHKFLVEQDIIIAFGGGADTPKGLEECGGGGITCVKISDLAVVLVKLLLGESIPGDPFVVGGEVFFDAPHHKWRVAKDLGLGLDMCSCRHTTDMASEIDGCPFLELDGQLGRVSESNIEEVLCIRSCGFIEEANDADTMGLCRVAKGVVWFEGFADTTDGELGPESKAEQEFVSESVEGEAPSATLLDNYTIIDALEGDIDAAGSSGAESEGLEGDGGDETGLEFLQGGQGWFWQGVGREV